MKTKKTAFLIGFTIIALCIIMAVVDGVIKADYLYKSVIKLVLFLAVPFIMTKVDKSIQLNRLFFVDKKSIKISLLLGLIIYGIILGGYFLLKDVFDFSKITNTLASNIGVRGENFIYVSLYISFVNSLLEEFFFRGFGFLTLKKLTGKITAYIFSAVVFSIYHIAMMIGWFSIWVFLIVLLGLFAGGIIFNYLNEKSGTIYSSWLVHMFANFAINTIGFMLFRLI